VAKAIRKEPGQRYTSVAQFSEDISRHLRGEPVIAHHSTFLYRSNKFIRRHKLGFVTGLLMFALVVSGVLTIVRAERKARRQQTIAERRFNDLRKVANSLIFEVHDSIRSLPGATAARKIILERAQEYLDSLAADSRSDPLLLRELSAAYIRIAGVLGNSRDANLGNSALSLQDYRRAVEMRETVAAALPSDRDARRELAESEMALAMALQGSREADAASGFLDKATAILEPLAAADTGDSKIQYALAKATEHKAGLYADQGQFKSAQTTYEKSLAMYQHVAEMDPGNRDYRIDVAYAHKHVGGTLIMQKQLQPALEQYRAALVIDERELRADPRDASIRYNITFTYSDTGYILGQEGKIDEALGYYHKALVIRTDLAEADPQDKRSRGGLANTYSYIGGLLWKKGDRQGSLEAHKKALALRQALSLGDPTNEPKRLAVAQSQAEIGEAYASMAFSPHANKAQRSVLCRQAETFLQPSLPILVARKGKLFGGEAESLAVAQKAADRCNVAISPIGTRKDTPRRP
jgi:non-specific serine/threonine protein kinase/serine/threonine-protein kinase